MSCGIQHQRPIPVLATGNRHADLLWLWAMPGSINPSHQWPLWAMVWEPCRSVSWTVIHRWEIIFGSPGFSGKVLAHYWNQNDELRCIGEGKRNSLTSPTSTLLQSSTAQCWERPSRLMISPAVSGSGAGGWECMSEWRASPALWEAATQVYFSLTPSRALSHAWAAWQRMGRGRESSR